MVLVLWYGDVFSSLIGLKYKKKTERGGLVSEFFVAVQSEIGLNPRSSSFE